MALPVSAIKLSYLQTFALTLLQGAAISLELVLFSLPFFAGAGDVAER
jgi:hypothetical protein